MSFINKNWENVRPPTCSQQLLHAAFSPKVITEGTCFYPSLLWNVSDSQLPHRCLLPVTDASVRLLPENKEHLDISLFCLLFCWCCILSASLGSLGGLAVQHCLFPFLPFPESTVTWGAIQSSVYMAFINKHSAYIVVGWSKKLACANEHLTTQQSSCCSLQCPEVAHVFHFLFCCSQSFFWKQPLVCVCVYFGTCCLVLTFFFFLI